MTNTSAELVRPVRVFLSSPSDLRPERTIVKQVVQELNQSPVYRDRLKLDVYAYEDDAPARAGLEPQVVVDRHMLLPEDADILICMFWLRMGTPTAGIIDPETGELFHSGTEYEFLSAYRANQKHGRPLLLLYRCMRPPEDLKALDPVQFTEVEQFFARFKASSGDLKGMTSEFKDRIPFKDMVRHDLEQLLQEFLHDEQVRSAQFQFPSKGRQHERPPVLYLPDNLPRYYVERREPLDMVRAALLDQNDGAIGIVASKAAAVHGQGGLGKTVLARAICEDTVVRRTFPDGVLWATLGQQANPLRHLRDWIHALGGDVAAATNNESGSVELRRLLAEREMLLVLDDVWVSTDGSLLDVGGPRCRTLLTTRDSAQVSGTKIIPLSVFTPDESRILLRERLLDASSTGERGQDDETLANSIAERLGHLPLALDIVGALMRSGVSWADINEALNEGELRFLEHGQRSVLIAIATSVRALSEDEQHRYHELAVFPRSYPLNESSVTELWDKTSGLRPRDSRKLLAKFRERALIQTNFTLHDLVVDYLHAVVIEEQQRSLHNIIGEIYLEKVRSTWDYSKDNKAVDVNENMEVDSWRWLAWHLGRAGQTKSLKSQEVIS